MEGQYFGYQLHSAARQNPQNKFFSRGAKIYFCSSFATPTGTITPYVVARHLNIDYFVSQRSSTIGFTSFYGIRRNDPAKK
jgi:hypothetical protein